MKIDSIEPTNPVACEPGGEPPPPPPARGGVNAEKFWTGLTAQQAFDLLKAAPKIAGPWTPTRAGLCSRVRRDHKDNVVAGQEKAVCVISPPGKTAADPFFDTPAEADAALRELGWILVD
jgi:hypothetical protein